MTPTPSTAPATERGAVLEALNCLNLAEWTWRQSPSDFGAFVDYQNAMDRFSALVEQVAKEEETNV